jgi:hypothetical protein
MAIEMKIGGGKFRLFRKQNLQLNYLIISSHGMAIAGKEDWSPDFTTVCHFNREYGQTAKGSPPEMFNRVIYKDKIESIDSNGLVGDYVLSKFQGYHDVAQTKKQWQQMKQADPALEYEETYAKIHDYVGQSDPGFDVLTIRHRYFSKEATLSAVCDTLLKEGLTYGNIICLFCRVKEYSEYHNALQGV